MYYQADVLFSTRGEAEDTLNALNDIMDVYTYVTVADLYDLAGKTPNYMYSKYGWTDLKGAKTMRLNNHYCILFRKTPQRLENISFTKWHQEPKTESNISVDIIVTIDGKKYKLVPVDDD